LKTDPTKLTTIVFDVDGTLYRQGPLRRAMLGRLLRSAIGNPKAGLATYRALAAYRRAQELLRDTHVDGGLARAQLRLACQHAGQEEHVIAPIIARWFDREPLALLERLVEPALLGLLSAARARGLRLGVLSDYPATAKLEAMRLTEFFEVVVTAQDDGINRFKPHPSGLREALRRLRATPSEALYVGDRYDVDAAVARAAGVPCIIIGARRPRRPAPEGCLHVTNYDELHATLFPPRTT
jgi:FMN phosphatase YigB (HAD superfamily)